MNKYCLAITIYLISLTSIAQVDSAIYLKSKKVFVGDGVHPLFQYLIGKDSIYIAKSFKAGIRDSNTNIIFDYNHALKLSDFEKQLLQEHRNLNFISFYPLNSDLYEQLKKIQNLKSFRFNSLNSFQSVQVDLNNLDFLNTQFGSALKPLKHESWDSYRKKIKALVDLNGWENIEYYPNLEYLEIFPINRYIKNQPLSFNYSTNKLPFKEIENDIQVNGNFCDFDYSQITDSVTNLKVVFFNQVTCYKTINLPLDSLERLVIKSSIISKIWNVINENNNLKFINLQNTDLPQSYKRLKLRKLEKVTFIDVSHIAKNSHFDKVSTNLKEIIISGQPATFNSKHIKNLDKLVKLHISGLRDRSFGFKLPDNKSKLKSLKLTSTKLWFIPRKLEEYTNIDTLELDVAFYRKRKLKKILLSMPHLNYVRISNNRYTEKIKRKHKLRNKRKRNIKNSREFNLLETQQLLTSPTKFERDIIFEHPNKSLDINIETKWNESRNLNYSSDQLKKLRENIHYREN